MIYLRLIMPGIGAMWTLGLLVNWLLDGKSRHQRSLAIWLIILGPIAIIALGWVKVNVIGFF